MAERRARARRQRKQRRWRLLAALALVAIAVVAGLELHDRVTGGSDEGTATAAHAHTPSGATKSTNNATGSSSGAGTELVRNARPQPDWRPHPGPVPILVYHALGTPPSSEAYPGLYVSRPEFREEMAWLAAAGYQGVTLDEVERAWYHHGTLPAKPIVITFDNGYPEQVRFAPSVLGRYGWPGVLFEITEEHLTPPYIRPVIERGWEVDSHSATHPDLTQLGSAELTEEVAGSRKFLQRTYHVPSDNFCYPSSIYDESTIAAVKGAGYVGAVTEEPGYASRDRPYELNRYEIEGGQGVETLASDLQEGAGGA